MAIGAEPLVPDPRDDYLPWLAILGAWIGFGSFAVPMKAKRVVDAKVDPLVFQCYKTFWTFITSHLVLCVVPYTLSWWGLLSGLSWVPAGVAAVVSVQNVGIACGQAVWQVTIILTSSIWGFLILKPLQEVYSWPLTLLALAMLALGSVGMTLSFSALPKVIREPVSLLPISSPGGVRSSEMSRSSRCGAGEQNGNATMDASRQASGSAVVGIGAALFNGVWGGSNLVPSHFSKDKGLHFVLSFAFGALIVNIALFGSYCIVRWTRWRLPPPSFHVRTMLLPGFLSGTLWSFGNICSLYAVNTIGQGIGYSLVQSSIIVSGLWGIIYYREMHGWPLLSWVLCCLTCLSGTVLLALQKKTAG